MIRLTMASTLACLLGFSAAMLPAAAFAHPVVHAGHGDSFVSGFLHPVLGSDHLVAMIAVGFWAACLGGRALLAVPLAFIGTMTAGALLGYAGVPMPVVEQTVAMSLVVIGLMICLLARFPTAWAASIIAGFAAFHGYAHGAEIPDIATPLLYCAGFVAATAMLLAAGVSIGLAARGSMPAFVVRGAGAAVAAFGLVTVLGAIA